VRIGVAAAVLVVVVVAGWREFLFLTDDAFIAFRYVSNSMMGRGLVWNPPPFQPVEGYTSFLWVVLLRGVWSVTGLEPPAVANLLSLGFGFGTLFLVWRIVAALPLPAAVAVYRGTLVLLVLFGTAISPVFSTWLSSGLETSLFNFCLTWWIATALAPEDGRGHRWLARLSMAAAATALTRPDGLLLVPATLVLAARGVLVRRERAASLAGLLPLLLIAAHVAWRRSVYGEWLPNTYYAKHVGVWPEAGWRYFASFVVENGGYAWLLLAAAAGLRLARDRRDHGSLPSFGAVVVAATLAAHFAYYTFVIGGDHFEYRVYSHLVACSLVAAVWLAARTFPEGPRLAVAAVAACVVLAQPVAWVRHFWPREPVAASFPAALRPVLAAFDHWQQWLGRHMVCGRLEAHRAFIAYRTGFLPSRDEGKEIVWTDRPVISEGAVGLTGWALPNVAVIDTLGLNDWVVARTPAELGEDRRVRARRTTGGMFTSFDADADGAVTVDELRGALTSNPDLQHTLPYLDQLVRTTMVTLDADHDGVLQRAEVVDDSRVVEGRLMAHDRHAPPGYVEGFRPNVFLLGGGRVKVAPRVLTDAEIRAHEARFRSSCAAGASQGGAGARGSVPKTR